MARTNKPLEADEQQIGQDHPREMPSTGPAFIEPAVIEPVDRVPPRDKLDALAFMEEPVEVVVAETTDKNANPFPEVWNDGRVQRFVRGQPITVRRKFVEVLARAKKTSYTQEKYKDAEGTDTYRNIPHTGLEYPFAVIRDSDKGRAWLKSVLAEG